MVPQIIFLLLTALGLGIALEQHGKPKTGNNNVFINLISSAITFWILWAGGFFSVFFK